MTILIDKKINPSHAFRRKKTQRELVLASLNTNCFEGITAEPLVLVEGPFPIDPVPLVHMLASTKQRGPQLYKRAVSKEPKTNIWRNVRLEDQLNPKVIVVSVNSSRDKKIQRCSQARFHPSKYLVSLVQKKQLTINGELLQLLEEQEYFAQINENDPDNYKEETERISRSIESLLASLSRRANDRGESYVQITNGGILLESIQQELTFALDLSTYDLKDLWNNLSNELCLFATTTERRRPWGIIKLDEDGEVIIEVIESETMVLPEPKIIMHQKLV